MVAFYPLCAFGDNRVAASSIRRCMLSCRFDHVDHLHPDWAIALAASANGRQEARRVQRAFGPASLAAVAAAGFRAGADAAPGGESEPGCDGIVLGGHGLFTWGTPSANVTRIASAPSIRLSEFIDEHRRAVGTGVVRRRTVDAKSIERRSRRLLPFLRGIVSSNRRVLPTGMDRMMR